MKKLTIVALIFAFTLPTNAQVFRSYKKEDVVLGYYQLPTNNVYAQRAYFKLIESQEDTRELVGKVGKFLGDKVGGESGKKLSDGIGKMSKQLLQDDTQEQFYIDLFPDIFYHATEDLGVNVYFKRGFSPMATKSGDKWVYTWKVDVKIDAYYKDNLIWSQDWKQVDGREENGTFDPGQNQSSYTNYLKKKAYRYARTKIYNRYGLRRTSVALPVFYTKALDSEYKDIMKSFAATVEKFSAKGLTEDVKSELESYIPKWQEPLKNFKKGTSRKEAREDKKEGGLKLHDKNAWALYYNIGLAQAMLQNDKEAKKNIAEAIDLRRIKPKEFKNKDGEVKGSITLGNTYGKVQMYLQAIENFGPDYVDGMKAQEPMFAYMFKNEPNLNAVSSLTGSYMFSDFYSKKFELGIFYNFFPTDMKGNVKKVDGVITKNNTKIAHYKFRSWPILGKRTKIYSGDKKLKSVAVQGKVGSLKTGRSIFPTYTEKEWGFVTETHFDWTLKWFHSPSTYAHYNAKYDWNGDILLNGKIWNDNWLAMFKSDVPDAVKQTSELRIKYNKDFKITNIEGGKGISTVDFNWSNGRYVHSTPAKADYKKEYKGFNDKGDPTIIIENGTKHEVKYSYDEQGNWTEMTYGDYVIRRTIAY